MNALRKIEEDTYKLFSSEDKQALVLLPSDYIYHPVEISVADLSYVLEKAIFPYDDNALPSVQVRDNVLIVNDSATLPADITRAEVIADILESLAVLKYLDTYSDSTEPTEPSALYVEEELDDVDDFSIALDDDIEYYIPIIDADGNETEWSFSQDRWDSLVISTSIEEAAEIIAWELHNINISLRENTEDNIKVIKNFILTCSPKEDFVSDVVDFVNNHA